MADPDEGLDGDGVITTGASVERIPPAFLPVVRAAIDAVQGEARSVSVHVYGSVATGRAMRPHSDVDLLTIGLDTATAAHIGQELTERFVDRCRSVEIAVASPDDLVGGSDEAYGNRVFLHHYCVHLAGPNLDRATSGFPGDRRAARGFNGDIGRHHRRWLEMSAACAPTQLASRIARKTLLAVAGLVSIHDGIWTTDRRRGLERWSDLRPALRDGLTELHRWAHDATTASGADVERTLSDAVAAVVEQFDADIGLWDSQR